MINEIRIARAESFKNFYGFVPVLVLSSVLFSHFSCLCLHKNEITKSYFDFSGIKIIINNSWKNHLHFDNAWWNSKGRKEALTDICFWGGRGSYCWTVGTVVCIEKWMSSRVLIHSSARRQVSKKNFKN
jgi:hypothetical protein